MFLRDRWWLHTLAWHIIPVLGLPKDHRDYELDEYSERRSLSFLYHF